MVKTLLIIVVLSLLLFVSCEITVTENTYKDLVCKVEDPINDLEWLSDMVRTVQLSMRPTGSEIIQYIYKDQYVFYVDLCYQCPDGLIQVFNCEGEVICEFGGFGGLNTCPDFFESATDSTMLFRSIQN